MFKYHKFSVVLFANFLSLALFQHNVIAADDNANNKAKLPANYFDLSLWSLDIPVDLNSDMKGDVISPLALASYSQANFFYLDDKNRLVFASPNKAVTSPTSTNTRSELRYLLSGDNNIASKDPRNNFALAVNKYASNFGAIGGKMEATLQVDHVAKNARYPDKYPAYSAVIGQIHALKLKGKVDGFGYGNEPLKIFYKKWPHHDKGSVFWTYERNLSTDDEARIDIAYPVWGNSWDNTNDPTDRGIALGEEFSYTVNVYQNIMQLVFTNAKQGERRFIINLADNIDANGNIDVNDHPRGYAEEPLYFKAGLYNQCSTKVSSSFRYPACAGTGDWATDYANGDYAQARFSRLVVTQATPISQEK